MSAQKQERIRLNLVVSPAIKERIERLQTISDATNLTEVVRRALATYEELITIQNEGGRIIVENGDQRERLRFV